MASVAEIAVGANSYIGDKNLGGGSFGSFQLDLRPIEDLARYTMLYNRAEYEQRQKDAEAAAVEIADVTSYDLTTGIPKDAKLLADKYEKLTSYVRDNPNALDYRNKKEWGAYKKMRNDLDNDLKGAKVRNTMWSLRQKEVQEETDPEKRKLMQEELDKEIADTDIRTPIKYSQQFADPQIKLPPAPELTFDVTKTAPNGIITRNFSVFNVPKARANGDVFSLGLDETVDLTTPEGKRAAIAKKKNFWIQGAETFNSVINAKDPTSGEFIYKTKITDAAGNVTYQLNEDKLSKLPRNILNLVKETNEYLKEAKADIKAGNLKDKFEKPITFGEGALDENDYKEINYDDGLSPEELALVAQYASWKGDTYSTKVQQTDNAIQIRGQDITAAHNKATEGITWAGLKLDQDKWKQTMTGGETVKNGAMEFAKRLYADMEKLSDKNGVISPSQLRKLDVEQLKYLGVEVPQERDKDGKIINSGGFRPLTTEKEMAIQLVNGKINVFIPREGEDAIEKTADGRYAGLLDNTKSTNIFNIATNRLNEQLKTAGAKELNAYMPIDLGTGGVSTNTVGGGTSESGGSKTKETDAQYYKRTGKFRPKQ